jgi:acyl dehydratase
MNRQSLSLLVTEAAPGNPMKIKHISAEEGLMERIENRTFDEIQLGDTASLVRTLTHQDIEVFAIMSGDINPAHVDQTFAKSDFFHKIVAHGMWGAA